MSKNTRTRILLTAVAALLLVTMTIGGTLAWLQASSNEVTNTFKGSSLAIAMKESPLKTGEDYDGKTIDTTAEDVTAETNYKMVPGVTLQKDPYAIVTKGSEPCYVFVVVTKSNNFDTFMTEEYNDADWTQVTGYENVWVYNTEVDALNATEDVNTSSILAAEAITVKTDVDAALMSALTEATYPTLTFKAYAIQSKNLTNGYTVPTNAAEIWKMMGITDGVIVSTN